MRFGILKNVKDLVGRIRQLAGDQHLPFIAGELGRFYKENEAINIPLQKLPDLIPYTGLVSSAGLEDKGDGLHFNSESSEELGKRYAQEMQRVQSDLDKMKVKK